MEYPARIPRALPLWTIFYVLGICLGIYFPIPVHISGVALIGTLVVLGYIRLVGGTTRYFFLPVALLLGLFVFLVRDCQEFDRMENITALHWHQKISLSPDVKIEEQRDLARCYVGRVISYEAVTSEQAEVLLQIDGVGSALGHVCEKMQRSPIKIVAKIDVYGVWAEHPIPGDTTLVFVTLDLSKALAAHAMANNRHQSHAYYQSRKVDFVGRVTPSDVKIQPSHVYTMSVWERSYFSFIRELWLVRSYLSYLLQEGLSVETASGQERYAILAALVLGDRYPLRGVDRLRREHHLSSLHDSFKDAGVYHLLSVSGLHLTIVSYLVYLLVTKVLLRLPRASQVCVGKRIAALCGLLMVICYTLVTGAEIATIRAAVMMASGFLALFFRRRSQLAESLSLAVLGIVVFSPHEMMDVSFLLSVSAVLGIAYLRPFQYIQHLFHHHRLLSFYQARVDSFPAWMRWLLGKCLYSIEMSIAALMTTAPICAYFFHEFQGAGPPWEYIGIAIR